MRKRSKIAIRGACAFVVVSALRCGGDSERPVDSGPPATRVPDPTPTAETLALAEAQCDYLERCDPDSMFLFARESRAACEEYFSCQASRFVRAVLEERVACIESLRTRACPDTYEEPWERFSAEMKFPWGPDCGVPTLDDILAPRPGAPGLGERCLDEPELPDCAVGNYCVRDENPFIGTFYCGTCEPFRALGAPCTSGDFCVEGATCVNGECRTRRALGEACDFDAECPFYTCRESICISPSAPTPYAQVVGGPCGDAIHECGNQAALYCHIVVSRWDDGVCRALPDEGEPCEDSSAYLECRLGQACANGRCVAVGCSVEIGEPCSGYCEAGDCVEGVCVAAAGEGAPCEVSCGSLPCLSRRCGGWPPPREENGARCDFDGDCESYFCERDVGDYCEGGSCSIPACDGCGVCADRPTVEICPSM